MPQLDPNFYISELFWLGICFVILYLAASHVIVPRMQAIFQIRQTQLQTTTSATDKDRTKAQNLQEDYEQLLAEGRRKAHDIIAEATHDLVTEVGEHKHKTVERLQQRLKQAELRFEQQKQTSMRDIEAHAQELSGVITEKLLSVTLLTKAPKRARSRSGK